MRDYMVYAEFLHEHQTEAPTAQMAIENFKAYLELFTIEEILERITFSVDDLTANERAEVVNWE